MFSYLLAFTLILFGVVNLTSTQANFVGWILVIFGVVLLATKLSGPAKPKRYTKGNSGGAQYDQTYDGDSSGSSPGDGGGGGD